MSSSRPETVNEMHAATEISRMPGPERYKYFVERAFAESRPTNPRGDLEWAKVLSTLALAEATYIAATS